MAKTVELLLTESIETLGIVGDVVKVRTGFARNYLLPRDMATVPSEEKIKALASKRAEAERNLAELRKQRESMVEKLDGLELVIERSCNDQGLLYGSVTQQEVATLLQGQGFAIRARDVRLGQTIKRVDSYEIHIKPESDLEAIIKLKVNADRPLEMHKEPVAAEAPVPAAEGAEAEAPAPKAKGKEKAKDAAPAAEEPKVKGKPKAKKADA